MAAVRESAPITNVPPEFVVRAALVARAAVQNTTVICRPNTRQDACTSASDGVAPELAIGSDRGGCSCEYDEGDVLELHISGVEGCLNNGPVKRVYNGIKG